VEQYEPEVTCVNAVQLTAPSYDSCKEIVDRMDWSLEDTKFGTVDQPGVEVRIPVMMKSSNYSLAIYEGAEYG